MFQPEFVEKTKTHISCSGNFFRKWCRLWDNVETCSRARRDTDDSIIWRMRSACWITKATSTHSEYVRHIALPLHQWLQERPSLLHYSTLPVLFLFW